jgi:hypothetical protein
MQNCAIVCADDNADEDDFWGYEWPFSDLEEGEGGG